MMKSFLSGFGLVAALSLLVIATQTVWAAEKAPPVINLSAIDSVKQVDTICIGYIDGNIIQAYRFKLLLKQFLTEQGFQVSNKADDCEATLLGSLNSFERWALFSYRVKANASVKLISPNYKTLWQGYFEPHYSLRHPYAPNGLLNRARDISCSLARAKQKAK